ncbi:MAG: class I SAM-dependent methyltransferase [Gammaproteobacteria bacterium]|nr:class I SAM-dependent methyltransferase [Gammaproteobacteria bacterium]
MIEDPSKYWSTDILNGEYVKTERYPYYQLRLKTVAEILSQRGGGRILDIGCGGGHISVMCAAMGHEVWACDFAETQVKLTANKLAEWGYPPRVRQTNILDLSAHPADYFDVILALSPLEYVPKPKHPIAYREMRRVLRKDGYIINQVINGLFDAMTFNSFTVAFWREHILPEFFGPEDIERYIPMIAALMTHPNKPDVGTKYGSTRQEVESTVENPFTYADEVRQYGFEEVDRLYYHLHMLPPLLFEQLENGDAIENNAYRLEEKYRRHWIGMLLSGDWISILEPQIPGR